LLLDFGMVVDICQGCGRICGLENNLQYSDDDTGTMSQRGEGKKATMRRVKE